MRVLVRKKVRRSALGFRGGSDSRAGEHFGDEFYALAMIVAREMVRERLVKKIVGAFGDAAGELSGCRVAVNLPARRIGSLLVDAGHSKGERIRIRGVTAAMVDVHGVIGNRGVQVGNRERAALIRFRVVIFEAENPFSRGSFRGAFAQGGLN